MSTPLRQSIETHENIARDIQAFLWEGKPHKSKPIEHTDQEYREFLEGIHRIAWHAYDTGAVELGWK